MLAEVKLLLLDPILEFDRSLMKGKTEVDFE
jgi:hypothetical protein